MSMPTKSFRQVLYGAAKRIGMVPEHDGLERSAASILTELLNSATKLAWEFYPWPGTLQIREEPIIDHPTITGARYVPTSTDERTLSLVIQVWDKNPLSNQSAQQVYRTTQADGLYFYNPTTATVWVQYKGAPPEFTETEWSSLSGYAKGALVWDAIESGHVFQALQTIPAGTLLTSTAHWRKIGILDCLAEPVKAGMVGAWHATEGQHGTARVKQEYMMELLEHEILQLQSQGNQPFFYS